MGGSRSVLIKRCYAVGSRSSAQPGNARALSAAAFLERLAAVPSRRLSDERTPTGGGLAAARARPPASQPRLPRHLPYHARGRRAAEGGCIPAGITHDLVPAVQATSRTRSTGLLMPSALNHRTLPHELHRLRHQVSVHPSPPYCASSSEARHRLAQGSVFVHGSPAATAAAQSLPDGPRLGFSSTAERMVGSLRAEQTGEG